MDKAHKGFKGQGVHRELKGQEDSSAAKGQGVHRELKERRVLKGQGVHRELKERRVLKGQHPPEAPEVPGRTPAARSRTKAGITTRVDSTVTHSNQQKKRFR